MKKRLMLLALLAVLLICCARLPGASAYFTTYIVTEGGYPIRIGGSAEFTETVSSWTKHLTVTCGEDSEAVYVRARAFCGSLYTLEYDTEGGHWAPSDDGYYYYTEMLEPGQTTHTLHVHIAGVPENPEEGEQFRVIVVYETTPVRYHEDGTPYADWNAALTVGSSEEGGSTP